MDQVKIDMAKTMSKNLNQYKDSMLQPIIAQALVCDLKTATNYGHSHCNLISWYNGLFLSDKISMPYEYYFKLLLENKFCNAAGKTLVFKDKITPVCFGFDFTPEYIEDWRIVLDPSDLDPTAWYQLKIDNTSHYMLSCVHNNKLIIFDTHDRGYGAPAIGAKRIDKEHFKWLMKI